MKLEVFLFIGREGKESQVVQGKKIGGGPREEIADINNGTDSC